MKYAVAHLDTDPTACGHPIVIIPQGNGTAEEAIALAESMKTQQHVTPFQMQDNMEPSDVSWEYIIRNQIEFAVAYADMPNAPAPTLQIHIRTTAELLHTLHELSFPISKCHIKPFVWVPNIELGHQFTWDEINARSMAQTPQL